jgi:type IV pilus assembly protein PilY1
MKHSHWLQSVNAAALFASILFVHSCFAQAVIKSEDFTGTASADSWNFFNGACLTSGTGTSTTSPGPIPGCMTVRTNYYKQNLVGGENGDNTGNQTLPDPVGKGALRLTNGSPGGYSQNGAIVSATPFPTSEGIQITFKTVTYRGDSGGAGHDGADGISFYLMDASKPAGIGAWGGSLGYTCSNANPPYDGLVGAYLGLGIDEYGNFLNGTSLMSGYTGTNSATGDNTKFGYGYKPGRIGMRGAGSVAWNALTAAYGTNLGSSSPYYPASLATTCASGTYDSVSKQCIDICSASSGVFSTSKNSCAQCSTGYSYSQSADTCGQCSSGYTYDPTANTCSKCTVGTFDQPSNQCINICTSGSYSATTNSCINICTAGTYNSGTNKCISICSTGTYNGSANKCEICTSGYTYNSGSNKCTKAGFANLTPTTANPTTANPTSATPTSAAPNTIPPTTTSPTYSPSTTASPANANALAAVQKTCSTGHLWNYSNPTSPTDAGEATLANANNTAGILDYAPIPNAYQELSSLATPITIATENAMKRSDATVIFYNLKITQDGLLSLAYSANGGAYQSVIKNQSISTANGPVPDNVLFGLAASTGGSNNIHEIMCFKAAPSTQSGSSTSVNEKLAAKVEAGTQAYFAFYDQNNWTGAVTANNLIDNNGTVSVSTVANWDASCVLTGTGTSGCLTTGATGPVAAESTSTRVMLTCRGLCNGTANNSGIALAYANLSMSQKNSLNAGDSQGANRVSYLRGDRSNEVTTVGSGLFRAREGILGDIVDSSPIWVGPPLNPYTAVWGDRLPANPSGTPDPIPENSASQTYTQFIAAKQTRLNVVYGGANDGFLHGFRSGSFDLSGAFVNNSGTPNDGLEVLAYMPKAVLSTIHNSLDSSLDYSNTQYGHNFFVDATPTADDLFYSGAWHTWLVGGLGAGGASIYALDITDPTSFSEANAASVVIGEWSPSTISCATPGGSSCGSNLGNTYGTPQIRRMHNGTWGVIFGNGFNSATGDAGIYVMTVDPTNAQKTFYYLTTGTASVGNNGVAFVSPVDLDGDHIVDFVYVGDLKGNVWRFDVTSTDPTNWAADSAPLFTTNSGQPITTKVQPVVAIVSSTDPPQVLIEFGTGGKTLLTNSSPTTYVGGTQSLYAIWDWNFSNWNSQSATQFRSLAHTTAATGLSGGLSTSRSNLQVQTFTASTTSPGNIDGTSNSVCWKGLTICVSGSNTKFGWYADLPTASGLPGISEQIVYNPVFFQGAFIINSTLPANNIPTSCSVLQDAGYTYVVSAVTGSTFSKAFPTYTDLSLAGVATSATGTPYVVSTAENTINIVYQTVSGTPGAKLLNVPNNSKAKRNTWVELR